MRKTVAAVVLWLTAVVSIYGQAPATKQDVEARANALLSKMTLQEKLDYIGGVRGFYIRAIERLGIPELKMSDGPVGVRNFGPATTFGGIGLAATFDPAIAERVGRNIGRDARARGVHFMLGPGVNIHRAPMNGRNFEYFGEDPFLAARTTASYIEGMQSEGVIATVKHYMGNNSEYDRHNTNSIIDERTMREIYLPAFEAAVREAHVGAIMDSYNLINGEHATENNHVNNEIAKKDWGFDGIIMSDWSATYDAVAAANGGLDLEMPSGRFMNPQNLEPAITAGKVSQATIDDKVRRILRTAIRFGFFDRPQTDPNIPLYSADSRNVALDAAKASLVLLKNDGNLLPLDKTKIKTIALLGPDAYPAQPDGGGSAHALPYVAVSVLEGLTNEVGASAKVLYHRALPASFGEMAQATAFTTDANGGTPGLKAEYFSSNDFSGSPVTTRTEQHLGAQEGPAFGPRQGAAWPQNANSARWTGYFTPKTAGTYHVMVNGDREGSGYKLYVDGKVMIDAWQNSVAALNYVTVPLQPGSAHEIRLEYHGRRGQALGLAVAASDTMVAPEAKQLASGADAVIVCVGYEPSIETEGSDRSFRLPPGQDELIQAALGANKNVIVLLTSGGNVDSSQWIDKVPALVETWYPGQEGGTAVAQLLFGDFSPSGRLPVTFERRLEDNATFNSYYPQNPQSRDVKYSEGVFVGYRHFDKDNIQPLFPFGFGLSYTTFAYKNLNVKVATPDDVTVSFDVTNTGRRAGAEVAQVYVGDPNPTVPRPPKELKGFQKVMLQPGETRHVQVKLNQRAFEWWDPVSNKAWVFHPGAYNILVGRSAGQIELKGTASLVPGK